jgi:hypothetical protein
MTYLIRFFLFLTIVVSVTNCTKIETTGLGQDLIPPVDGISTFQTDTFSITAENGIFSDTSLIFKADDHILGNLQFNSNFGSTLANIAVQFNPFSQFNWAAPKDSISNQPNQGIDSAFLCLGLFTSATDNGIYGDTTAPITFNVYRVNSTNFKSDSNYRIATNPNITDDGVVIGTATIMPKDLKNKKYFNLKQNTDSITNQIRIKLNITGQNWVRDQWLLKDTNNTFKNATSFTTAIKGFVIKPVGGNAVMKIALAQNNTSRFEVWYRYQKNGKADTTNQFFYFNQDAASTWISGNANYIQRNVSGTSMLASTGTGADNLVYIESTPGSYTKIKIPYLKSFPNKLIHRAELIVQEDPAFQSSVFFTPSRLYLDCFDTTVNRFLSVPLDYFISAGQVDFSSFGGDRKTVTVGSTTHSVYTFNISKYFQSQITRNTTKLDFRLYAPFDTRFYSQSLGYYSNLNSTVQNTVWPLINPSVFGRVVLGGGNHPNYRMKLRVIYSNL